MELTNRRETPGFHDDDALGVCFLEPNAELSSLAYENREITNPVSPDYHRQRFDFEREPLGVLPEPISEAEAVDRVNQLLDALTEDEADELMPAISTASLVDRLPIHGIVDMAYKLRSHPAMRNRGVERYVALALWIRGNFPKRDRNRTPVGVVAAVARSHYLKQERDYEDTMQAAEIKVIEWLFNPSSAPDGLIDCYNFLVEERNRVAIRKRRPTKTEVALLAMGYALGGTFFLGQHDITKRLCAIGVKTSRTTVRDAMAKLEGAGVIRKVKGPSFQKRHATEFGLEVPAQPSPAASRLWWGLFDSPALWRARKQRQPNLRLAVTGRPSLSGYPGVWGRDKTESDNVGSGGGIRSSFKKHWQKEDILTAASGREFEIIRELCGISNLKRQISKGQSCPNCPWL